MEIKELKNLQDEIIKENKLLNLIFGIVLVVLLSIFILLGQFNRTIFPIIFGTIFLVIIFLILKNILLSKKITIFTKSFKEIFVKSALKEVFANLEYDFNKGISEEEIKSIGVIDTKDRYEANDYIKGTFHNIKFVQSDVNIEEIEEYKDADGNTHTRLVTVFFGRFLIFDFNKKFKNDLIVVSKDFPEHLLKGYNFKKVLLEDMEFNKNFKVYAKNECEAFYILTPGFMEKVKNLLKEINSPFVLCFVDNKLHIGINNYEDSFECNVFKKIDEIAIKNSITKDIKVITKLVEELDLDNNLFKGSV